MPTKHFVFSPYVLSSSWKLFFSLSFLNLLLRWFGGVLVAQFDRELPLKSSSLIPPWFPGGKFHLRICWDIKSWLARPRGRPPIGWFQPTLPQNYFEAQSSFSGCISGQGVAAIFVLEIIFEIIFVLEITQHRFSSANWRATQLEACSPTNPGRLKHQIHILYFEEILLILLFALFS